MTASELTPTLQLLPWQQAIWAQFNQARRQQRLHHALLLSGMPGLGKLALAQHLAQALFCATPKIDGMPCGGCRDCRLFLAGNHPDFRRIGPDPASKTGEIRVDSIRELVDLDRLSTRPDGYKVVLIAPAEGMNRSAANSLLKTLEEPGTGTVMLLVTAQPRRLPATLRSRCSTLWLRPPAEAQALEWLATQGHSGHPLLALRLAHGAPLAALRFLDPNLMSQRQSALAAFLRLGAGQADPLAVAAEWMKLDLNLLFEWLGSWLADLLRLQAQSKHPHLDNPDQVAALERLAAQRDAVTLHRLWSQALAARRQLRTNLNPQLLLERLLAQWSAT